MDEAEIAQKQALNIPGNSVIETPESNVPEEIIPEVFSNNLPLDSLVLKHEVMEFLDVPTGSRKSTEVQSQVDSIIRWAIENSSPELKDILSTIDRQKRVMGIQFKDNVLSRMHRYVKLHNARSAIEIQMRAV